MKTNLIKHLACASLVLAVALTGCNPQQEDVNNGGTINSKVVMRSASTNSNQWEMIPDYPTQEEIDKVMALIGSGEATVVDFPAGCTEYIVQHLSGAHHMYSYKDNNGAVHSNIDGTASQEFFEIKELDGNWAHLNNFNCGKGNNEATHDATLMDNGFQGARTLNEYASSTITAWRIFLIDGTYYLGIDFSQKKGDGEIEGDGIYDDWVVKIIPLNGESVDPEDDPKDDPEYNPEDDPDYDPTVIQGPHVEFDIHQQEHKDWKEIKTSIHLRDTVDFTVLLPIPEAYQAESDDFDLRLGEKYEYLAHSITLVDKTYEIIFTVTHKAEGIEVYVQGSECAEALRVARALYGDGLTFEVHTYVKNEVTDEQVWSWLKTTQLPTVSPETKLIGQITSAFYPEDGIDFGKDK